MTPGCSTVRRGGAAARVSAESSSRPSCSTTARSTAALRQRQPLPDGLEHRLLLAPAAGPASRADGRGRPCGRPPPARRPMSRAPAAARRRAGCRPDRRWRRRGRPRRLMPLLAKRASMNAANMSARNLLEPHHRAGLVERPPRADHLLHQARLGAGEDVADLALVLRRGAQRVLDAAAVEAVDGLELVERDDDRTLARGGEPAGQGEDLGGEAADVALASGRSGKATEKRPGPMPSGSKRISGRVEVMTLGQPARGPGPSASRAPPAPGRSPRERPGRSCSC